eukprot:s9413_g4.t1
MLMFGRARLQQQRGPRGGAAGRAVDVDFHYQLHHRCHVTTWLARYWVIAAATTVQLVILSMPSSAKAIRMEAERGRPPHVEDAIPWMPGCGRSSPQVNHK